MIRGVASLAAIAILGAGTAIAAPACPKPGTAVREEGFVPLGGIEQWVTVKGADCANPVILFLHGDPGNPLSPYADAIYGAWEKEFTLVQWDQRGAGRTFGRSPPGEAALSIERMAADGIELAEHLNRRLGSAKVILLGGSWGSILGVRMAVSRPELFHAYLGVSQVVSYRENPAASYAKVTALAKAAGDAKTFSALEAMGPPPWDDSRRFGALRRATRAYEAKTATPSTKAWWIPAEGYDTPARLAEAEEGEDYSYLQFVGRKGDGLFSRVDLGTQGASFAMPVVFIHGAEDLVAVPEVARRYVESIAAPRKAFVLVPQAGHDPNPALVAAQLRAVRQLAAPTTK